MPDISGAAEPGTLMQSSAGAGSVLATDPTELGNTDEVAAEGTGTQAEILTRLEAQLELQDLFENENYPEAVPVAEHVVALTQEEFGEISSESAIAISYLAEVQRRAGEYEDSSQNFLTSSEIFREAEGVYTESAIMPLVGLGASYHALEYYSQALTVFEEARTVSRRIFGLLNEEQIVILDHLANTLLSMEQYQDAEEQQLMAMQIMERKYGSDTLEFLPALYKHAMWLRRSYRYNGERDHYTRALDIIRRIEGRDSLLLVRPLQEIANSYRTQRVPEGRGLSSLRRALAILQAQQNPDKLQMASVLRDLGDWEVAFNTFPAGNEYREAWALLDGHEDGERFQRRWFDQPVYVLQERANDRGLVDPDEPGARAGHVLVVFDVTPAGRTTNVSILESEPSGLKDETTARSIELSRFRPRMVDGEIVSAQGISRRFTFFYEPDPEEG